MSVPIIDPTKWLLDRDPEAGEVLSKLREGCPDLVDLLMENLYGKLYQRTGLTDRERFLLTIASAASAGAMPQVCYQSRLALKCGVSKENIYEALFHVAIFAGFANAMNAMNAVKDAIATLE